MNIPRWFELAQQFDIDNLKSLDDDVQFVCDNGISFVYKNDKFVYKRSIPFFIENEIYLLRYLRETGFVPLADKFDKYTIKMNNVGISQRVTNADIFTFHCGEFLGILNKVGIRHGDLTEQNIIVVNNKPIVIDWAEARLWSDPRPPKRPEGDEHWMGESMRKILEKA